MPNGENQVEERRINIPLIAGVGVGAVGLLLLASTQRGVPPIDIPRPEPIPPPRPDENGVPVNIPPVARISPVKDKFTVEETFTFNSNESSDPDGSIPSSNIWWEILDIDGEVLESQRSPRFTITFNRSGFFTIKLTVRDNRGAVSIAEHDFEVLEKLRPGEVIQRYLGVSPRARHRSAEDAKWSRLLELLENYVRFSGSYRGQGKYIANEAGEILPHRNPVLPNKFFEPRRDVTSLARWIKDGGVWIDYTEFPMFYEDGQTWIFGGAIGQEVRWNVFCDLLGVKELGVIVPTRDPVLGSTFFVDERFPNFIAETGMNRALTILRDFPSRTVFKTSDELPNLRIPDVPFRHMDYYTMFALKVGKGIYFYSHRNISPEHYSDFIKAVHDGLI